MRSLREMRMWLFRLLKAKLRAGCFAPLPLRRTYELDASGNLTWEHLSHEDPELLRTAIRCRAFVIPDYAGHCKMMDRIREDETPERLEARRKEAEAHSAAFWAEIEARRSRFKEAHGSKR